MSTMFYFGIIIFRKMLFKVIQTLMVLQVLTSWLRLVRNIVHASLIVLFEYCTGANRLLRPVGGGSVDAGVLKASVLGV